MEIGTIEREIHIEATPEVVYQVVSTPEHLKEWWPDDAELEPGAPGAPGRSGSYVPRVRTSQALTVVEADPPRRFSFRWVYEEREVARRAARCWSPSTWSPRVPAPC